MIRVVIDTNILVSAGIQECTDPDNNIFLECAQAADADYVVTGNQRHFPIRWKKTKVISARQLIERLIEAER